MIACSKGYRRERCEYSSQPYLTFDVRMWVEGGSNLHQRGKQVPRTTRPYTYFEFKLPKTRRLDVSIMMESYLDLRLRKTDSDSMGSRGRQDCFF